MKCRERVLQTLRHQVPDRIPLDIGATESSGMHGIAYNNLKAHLGIHGPARIVEPYQQVALIDMPILNALEIDAVPLHYEPRKWKESTLGDGSPCRVPEKWDEIFLPDGSREVRNGALVVARMPSGGFYYEPYSTPLAHITSASGIDPNADCIVNFDLPGFSDESWEERAARAKALHATGRAVVGNLCCHFLAAGQLLRGYTQFMCDLMAEKGLAHALLESLCNAYIRRADTYLSAVGQYLDVILVNDDLGTQNGPMLSPSLYREMIKPYQKRFFGHLHKIFPGALLLHSCGAIAEFIPDLIDCGVQAINPVQISAAGMDPERLNREYGQDLVFWGGGIDTQRTLNAGTPEQVREAVRRNVGVFAPGGGFVFTQVHNVQPDVSPKNVMAMLEALKINVMGGREDRSPTSGENAPSGRRPCRPRIVLS